MRSEAVVHLVIGMGFARQQYRRSCAGRSEDPPFYTRLRSAAASGSLMDRLELASAENEIEACLRPVSARRSN